MEVIFQADIKYIPIQDILQWIDMNRLTCTAIISQVNGEDVELYFEQGKIIFASSRKPGNRLGEFLVNGGALTGPQAFQLLNESRKTGKLFTSLVIEKKLILVNELENLLSKLVEKLLIEIFSCNTGAIIVTTPLPQIVLNGPIRLETGKAIFDAVRVFDEIKRDALKLDNAYANISSRLNKEDFQLPAMPSIIMQLAGVMEDEKSTFQDMAKLIMTDQVLISSLLKIANSSFYAGSGQVSSLQFAIVRLGMKEIRNIVTAILVRSMKFQDVPPERLQEILDNSMKIAFMASGLARYCKLDPEEAFMGGLLLDLGKTVILSIAKDVKIGPKLLDNLISSRHAEIGVMIAKKWNYPESIQHMIRYHHNQRFGDISNRMIDMIQIVDQMITTGTATKLDSEQMSVLGLSQDTVFDVYTKAIEMFEQIKFL